MNTLRREPRAAAPSCRRPGAEERARRWFGGGGAAVMLTFLKSLTRKQKSLIFLSLDLCLIPLALIFTRAMQTVPPTAPGPVGPALEPGIVITPYLLLMGAVLIRALGLNAIPLNVYGSHGLRRTGLYVTALSLGGAGLAALLGLPLPVQAFVVFGLALFVSTALLRAGLLQGVTALYRTGLPRTRVLIYGAGSAGTQLAQALHGHATIEAVAFLEDRTALQGLKVCGLPVHAALRAAEIARRDRIDRVLLALPEASAPKQAQIARRLQKLGLEVHTVPSFAQLVGEATLAERLTPLVPGLVPGQFLNRDEVDVGLEDTLVTPPGETVGAVYAGRVVLVSGAGGSIGSELCRQVLSCRPTKLVLYELSEAALFTVDTELRQALADMPGGPDIEIIPVLGSVADPHQVRQVLGSHGVEIILHAAAYKHVPLVEANPLAGLANNVLGTQTLARCALEAGVARFILISSDKAVRPAGVMGASKRLAELVVQDLAARVPAGQGPVFSMVRFGNVLGSSGSVVPVFQEQIARGGPVTVTDPEVTRYFMTLSEAVRLVLRAGAMAQGGEVFVLDMGKPVAIARLARQAIEAAGYTVRDADTPDGDIEIAFVGLRPGEKLHEELSIRAEYLTTSHRKIFCAREDRLSELEVASMVRALRHATATGDAAAARAILCRWVEGFEGTAPVLPPAMEGTGP